MARVRNVTPSVPRAMRSVQFDKASKFSTKAGHGYHGKYIPGFAVNRARRAMRLRLGGRVPLFQNSTTSSRGRASFGKRR